MNNSHIFAIAERVWKNSPVRKAALKKIKWEYSWMEKEYKNRLWGLGFNIEPHEVLQYWDIAGNKNNKKFRAQVENRLFASRRQTLNQYLHFAEGINWMKEAGLYSPNCRPHRNAATALGRISPEFRWAAFFDFYWAEGNPFPISRLNWNAVRRAIEAKKTGNMRVYAALAYPPVVMKELGLSSEKELVAFICPAYPGLPYEIARRIALGTSSVELSGNQLTKKEAHQWLLDGAPECRGWFAKKNGLPYHRSVRVMRWMLGYRQSERWDVLERKREMRVEGEPPKVCSILDILDEIQEEDIHTGRDSVATVMRRAAERMSEAWRKKFIEDHSPLAPVPHWAARLPRGIRLLNTAAELVKEGRDMQHCVGGYVEAVRRGECYIFSITTKDGRSTVELSSNLEIIQHKSFRNGVPPIRNEHKLRIFIDYIKRRCSNGSA